MPYSIDNPPEKIKDMPKHAQEIFIAAFNNAIKQYDGDEARANQVAYAAVKNDYKQDADGNWTAKEAHPHGEHICVCADCKKEVTVGTGEKCNTQKCPECGSFMTAKEPGENREAEKPIETVIAKGIDVIEIRCPDCHGDRFELEGSHLRCVQCGTLVEKNTEVTMKDELQEKYAEIIQEIGKRNAALDAARIKKIRDLCEELLAGDEPEEKKTKEALKEANAVLTWLREQKLMKTEDDVKFPAEAYAYVGDPEKPSGWKLRLWENPTDKITRKQLGAAAAALSPGGFRGQKVDIPREELSAVKRKIRAEYRKLDVADEDIPRWVQESSTRSLFSNFISLGEATVGTKGIAKVVVIKAGWGNPVDNHYYPAETLSRDYPVFEGAKMYADHQTEQEEKQRPEGSIRQWVASLKNVRFEEGTGIVGDAVIIEPWLQQKLATLRDQKLLSEMGISIRAAGVGTKGKIDGKEANVVERITRVRSVDFVTEAGAGGGVLLYETEKEFDIDVINLDVLRERRPDLVKQIENEVKEKTLKEVKKTMELEEELKDTKEQLETVTKERDEAQTKFTEAEKAQKKAEAKSVIDEAIGKSDLPEAAKERLVEKFKDAESADGIEDEIKAEKDYVDKLAEAGKVKGLGPTNPDPEKSKKELRESFKRLHPEWTDAQLDEAVNGR
jgi:cation transport regulator